MANNEETQAQNIQSDALNFAIPEQGFGTYLKGILPHDQRVLAGAFSVSMQQIQNISQIQLEKFAQAAYSNENMFGLNLVNGTDVPTDVKLAKISSDTCSVGGGVYGSFTMSNFFGAMSGLPYPLRQIYAAIQELETQNLYSIYQNLYLAVNWEIAQPFVNAEGQTVGIPNPNYQPNPALPNYDPVEYLGYEYQYKVTSVNEGDYGGGYGRDGAAAPTTYTYTLHFTDPNSTTNAGSFIIGQEYQIINIGDTDWNDIGYIGVPVVDGRFVATGPGDPLTSGSAYERVALVIDPGTYDNVPTLNLKLNNDPENVPGNYGTITVTTNSFTQQWITLPTFSVDTFNTDPFISCYVESPPGSDPQLDNDSNQAFNDIIDAYIIAADQEILNITTSSAVNFEKSNILNVHWDITGKALKQEQRARYISSAPVPIPFDKWIALYPTSQYIFVDAIPTLAANTLPHMYAQTLEHISDLDLTGGQSIIGMMREERNQERLNRAGLGLQNNLADDIPDQDKEQLILNGTLPGAVDGINGYTIPAFSDQSVPENYYDPCLPGVMSYNDQRVYVESDPIAAILAAPSGELNEIPAEELPDSPEGYIPVELPEILASGTDVVVPDTSFPCENGNVEPIFGSKPAPIATSLVGVGEPTPAVPIPDYPLGINQPVNIIPTVLDSDYTSSTLLPSVPTVQQAIEKVIECNCDCWVV